jgi:thioredoxin-related protein
MQLTHHIKYWLALAAVLFIGIPSSASAETTPENAPRGEILGAVEHKMPAWFKESFLDIQEDASEAGEDRHVMLFFQRDECPYCERMLRESIDAEPLRSFIQQNFDVIAINTKGDREIAFDKDTVVSEKELKEKLDVKFTPNLFFLNHENNIVARLNGYRSQDRVKHLLEYVQSKAYLQTSLIDYMEQNVAKGSYELRDNQLFRTVDDLSTIKTPLAVVFEDSNCEGCDYLHDRLLTHPDVLEEVKAFTVVRLNAESDQEIINTEGKKISPRQWARELELTYRPAIMLYTEGKEINKINSMIYPFHFREAFRYIRTGAYKTMSGSEYSKARIEELLLAGENVDYGE